MSQDQEELSRLKSEMQRLRDQIFHMAKLCELGKLSAVVVHELSQPLLGIKAFAQIIRRKYPKDDFIEPKMKMIEQQALHMEGILDSLRQYSSLERADQNVVDPMVPVRSALDIFHERAKKLRVRLQLQAPQGLPQVRCSRGRLQQILTNLISNAIDELQNVGGGDILLQLEAEEGQVRIRVADTGRGVPDDVRQHLFEPFFTTKGGDKGTGLGLSICRDIAKLHGGEIHLMPVEQLKAKLGEGFATAFEVTLLAAAPEK